MQTIGSKEKINYLVITTENPYPPRNGITIPVFNYIKSLGKSCNVDLCVINTPKEELTEHKFGQVISLDVLKKFSIFDEIKGGGRKFDWALSFNMDHSIEHFSKYDFIIASPIGCVYLAQELADLVNKSNKKKVKIIAAISDCYTAVLRNKSNWSSIPSALDTGLSIVRSYWMSRAERNLLSKTDSVWVQSEQDKLWLRGACKLSTNTNVRVVTNGVDSSLFDIEICYDIDKPLRFSFVGSQTSLGHYSQQINWFYNKVWKKSAVFDSVFIVKGGGLNITKEPYLSMKEDKSVLFDSTYKENIAQVYSDFNVLVAPIFKTYGFINKVGEAMSAGIVVLGDDSAFNAIGFAEDKVNCIKSNTDKDFIESINNLVSRKVDLAQIGKIAKIGAEKELNWMLKSLD